MGLAASQGRLLLLTARKSDLELQAQCITQQRLLLATQQETIADEYADATNNQIYQVRLPGTSEYTPLTVYSLNELYYGTDATSDADRETARNTFRKPNGNDPNGAAYGIWDKGKQEWVDPKKLKDDAGDTPDTRMQQNLLYGSWVIRTPDEESSSGWSDVMIGADARYRQSYYTADDNAAKAKYDSAMARVQRLDKQLELKLNQVETQHKAVETEVESVDKVISNNIESSFKYFS